MSAPAAFPEPAVPGPSAPASDPPVWWGNHLGETRWTLELARLLVDPVFVPVGLPRGDGRAVILLPGFGAGDNTLLVLAAWLWRLGYRPHLCGFVANVDCSDRALQRVERTLVRLHARTGRRVAIVGHSRGGHFGRALAARHPDAVSHVISAGADLQGLLGASTPTVHAIAADRQILTALRRSRHAMCMTTTCDCPFARDYRAPFPTDRVRLTSIYSKGDGVVRWQGCVVPYGDCVEVTGSHVGLIFNRKSYRVLAGALATEELEPTCP
jgi:triacylglycerol lipase